jgi:hypothetical protein
VHAPVDPGVEHFRQRVGKARVVRTGFVTPATALQLLALDALVGLDGTDELANRARAVTDGISSGLGDAIMGASSSRKSSGASARCNSIPGDTHRTKGG